MATDLSAKLKEPEREAWGCYLSFMGAMSRPRALEALERFVDGLSRYPETEREVWIADLCRAVVDEKAQIPVQQPLFVRLVAPFLCEHFGKREPWVAHWLVHFLDDFYKSKRGRALLGEFLLPRPEEVKKQLLRRALDWNPQDSRARESLDELLNPVDPAARLARMAELQSQFSYSLHELPAGVLFGYDGSAISECDQLLADVAEFAHLAASEGRLEQYHEPIAWWRSHFAGYRDYLLNRDKYADYAQYMNDHSLARRCPGSK